MELGLDMDIYSAFAACEIADDSAEDGEEEDAAQAAQQAQQAARHAQQQQNGFAPGAGGAGRPRPGPGAGEAPSEASDLLMDVKMEYSEGEQGPVGGSLGDLVAGPALGGSAVDMETLG